VHHIAYANHLALCVPSPDNPINSIAAKRQTSMILYGSPISPFVRKVSAFAAEKGLTLERVAVGLSDPNPDFARVSPFKKMPALADGDFAISDSTAIVVYLDTKYPETALIPADAENRARAIWFDEFADTIVSAAGGKIFFNRIVAPKFMGREGDETAAKQGEADLPALYDYLEGVIPPSGFLVGDQLSLADIAVASPFVNIGHCGVFPDIATYPKLAAYVAAIHARPSFAATITRERKILGIG
jgi:glutathione S-transferase